MSTPDARWAETVEKLAKIDRAQKIVQRGIYASLAVMVAALAVILVVGVQIMWKLS